MNLPTMPPPKQCLVCLVEVANRAPKTNTEMAGLQSVVNTIENALNEWEVLKAAQIEREAVAAKEAAAKDAAKPEKIADVVPISPPPK